MKIDFNAVYESMRSYLPASMFSDRAKAMLFAIGMQESRFEHRVQIGGPAHGFWQFEQGGGIKGVLSHPASKPFIDEILAMKGLDRHAKTSYEAVVDDDLLAMAFARLLLYTDPRPLPGRGEYDASWDYYYRNWRPGKPHRQTWDAFYDQAWN